jgi:hypothetical protein
VADEEMIHRSKPIFVGQPELLVDDGIRLAGQLSRVMTQEQALAYCDDFKRVVDGLYLKN